ncbi:hypothetical protein KA183_08690 [bacterium]|nr:hypothetical protein [bacterium]QQR56809.1 MAG: hypothetical protein IPG59_17685 [Candidatus Melainabacteria bacterium]
MNRQSLILSLLASSFALCGTASLADTIETTTTQTTTSTVAAPVFNLSANGTYQVVDPISGQLIGRYDQSARLVDGRTLQSGVVIVDKANGGLVATVDSNGNIVDIGVAPASQRLIVSIDTRRQDLNRRIDAALASGQINAAQASSMRSELETIASGDVFRAESVASLNYSRALQMGYGLDTLSSRLVPLTGSVQLTPVIAPQFVSYDGRIILSDGITSRKLRLGRRIDDEYTAGRLSANQVSKRKEDLNKISSMETKYRKNGELSNANEKRVSIKIDKLASDIDSNVATINHKRSQIGLRTD